MTGPKRILIVDPDADVARRLGPHLRGRGWQVHAAQDGSQAVEMAVIRRPDLVLFDEASPQLDVKGFLQILRTNPTTEHIAVVVTGPGAAPAHAGDAFVRKPYEPDDVLARIDAIFRRAQAAEELSGDKEIQGNLSHISLGDLLQVFASNRKTGRLVMRLRGGDAEIVLVEGRVVDVRGPSVSGEKALFRYFGLREGLFEFHVGRALVVDRVRRSVEDLLLEGMRQSDELERVRALLPPPDAHLVLAVERSGLPAQHPVTDEVVALLDAGGCTVAEAIDRCSATDYEVCCALQTLLEKGLAKQAERAPRAEQGIPVLAPAAIQALRRRLLQGRRSSRADVTGKLVLAAAGAQALAKAAEQLAALPGWRAGTPPSRVGTCGRLELEGGVALDIVAVPTDDVSRPLWAPCTAGAVGAVILDPGPCGEALASALVREGTPVVAARAPHGLDAAEGVRQLLLLAAR